jgi:hypothetical protein
MEQNKRRSAGICARKDAVGVYRVRQGSKPWIGEKRIDLIADR